jgi:sigma-B regulation protein RsbU (phosphoserine phosphatase)
MLKLEDFIHLPQLDALIKQLVTDAPGLTVVAGLDPRPAPGEATTGILPSGRSTIFRILMREILEACPTMRAVVVTEQAQTVRRSRRLRKRIQIAAVEPPLTYTHRITEATLRRPDLLVIDQLTPETAPLAMEAARSGMRVLSQLDTVFQGADVARHLLDLGVRTEALDGLAWVVGVQRLATQCPSCREPLPADAPQPAELRRRYPEHQEEATYFRAVGCAGCDYTGRQGDVAVFDIFRAGKDKGPLLDQPSLLSAAEYVFHLARRGDFSPGDVLDFESGQVRRIYRLLTTSEEALTGANAALRRKLAELEAANRVLEQRTEALISLQDIGQLLIASTDLDDVAARVCRRARELCGADRSILYYLRSDEQAEVLAVGGWDLQLKHQRLDAGVVFDADLGTEPMSFDGPPPGVSRSEILEKDVPLRAGLRVPLVAQNRPVGVMIVHATQRASFAPGEVALLQTFTNQAALAIHRAELIAEMVQKERMEREMELARQVQQSVLPRTFPEVPGFRFAARNEPARRVGGDFYDVIALDDERFGVVVADVSDKGMPAALYMALTRSLILAEARRERSPRDVLRNVNRLLRELGEPNMFVTIFYGVVERATRRMTFARAGHDRPLLLRGGAVEELPGQGAALGILDQADLNLTEEVVALEPEDRLVLYTDGLVDVLNPDGRLLGREGLRTMSAAMAEETPDALCARIFTDLKAYRGNAPQYDDMTILVVAVEPNP